jgi:hypothetical protein
VCTPLSPKLFAGIHTAHVVTFLSTCERVGRDVFKLMGRLIGLALCEKIPLGIPMASGFFKQLEADSIFPEIVSLVSV